MFTEAVDAVVTDNSFNTDFISVLAGISQLKMPVCSVLATSPHLSVAKDYPYLALMRTTSTAAARAMCNLVLSYGWAAAGLVRPAPPLPRPPAPAPAEPEPGPPPLRCTGTMRSSTGTAKLSAATARPPA